MQTEAVTWSQQVAGRRKCRPLGGAAPMAVFDVLEAAELVPLPPTPFVPARWSTATAGPDKVVDAFGRRGRIVAEGGAAGTVEYLQPVPPGLQTVAAARLEDWLHGSRGSMVDGPTA
ncbi:hypothetical protein [Streptomyces sp. NPDC047434]|uniref:hypothetical protein n=1 Tax=Streptomyces sp. NPDC047434 TaxID=3155143 RepID=UPI00340DA7A2